MKIKVGKKYRDASGFIVEITHYKKGSRWPYIGFSTNQPETPFSYSQSGKFDLMPCEWDLVEEVEDAEESGTEVAGDSESVTCEPQKEDSALQDGCVNVSVEKSEGTLRILLSLRIP